MVLRTFTLLGVVASMVGGVCIGIGVFWSTTYYSNETRQERMLVSIAREIHEHYVEEVPDRSLVDNAIRGMVQGLDDHSTFLDVDALLALEEDTSGRFGGIGIEVGMVDGFVTVLSPLDGTPAARAGIAAGDRIVEVDHESLKGRTLTEAIGGVRGKVGTVVHLRVRRVTLGETLDFDVTRDLIASVTGRMLSPTHGYVRIAQFDRTTGDDLAMMVADLQRDGPLGGLVLDLRNNPGGLLEAAVDVADAFLSGGLIVSTEGRLPDNRQDLYADADDLVGGAPLAVLINGRSASASEVVAGALQDRDRATVLGSESFGKGSVQSVMRFDGRAIKLTTARYLTPSGRSIQAGGIEPDIRLARVEREGREDYDKRLLAAALDALSDSATATARID